MDAVPFSAFFLFVHPKDADALALTCKVFKEWVDREYKRVGRAAVLPGGVWHGRLCKRARESVGKALPNHMPRALASLVDNECIRCHRRLLARVSKWGFAAHAPCIRGMLLNTYYVPEKLGLGENHLRRLPQETLWGYGGGYFAQQYSYQVVFRQPVRRFVPVEWTLKHAATVVYPGIVKTFLNEKRKAAEALRQEKERKAQRKVEVRQKREAALTKRRTRLDQHPQASLVYKVYHVMGSEVMGDYLSSVIKPKTSLKEVVVAAQKHDAQATSQTRLQVRCCLQHADPVSGSCLFGRIRSWSIDSQQQRP